MMNSPRTPTTISSLSYSSFVTVSPVPPQMASSPSSSPRTPVSPSCRLVANLSTPPAPKWKQPTQKQHFPILKKYYYSSPPLLPSSPRTPISMSSRLLMVTDPSTPPAPKRRTPWDPFIIRAYQMVLVEHHQSNHALDTQRKRKLKTLMSLRWFIKVRKVRILVYSIFLMILWSGMEGILLRYVCSFLLSKFLSFCWILN